MYYEVNISYYLTKSFNNRDGLFSLSASIFSQFSVIFLNLNHRLKFSFFQGFIWSTV